MPSRRHASDSSPQLVRVQCSHCDWHQTYGPGEMLDTLRGLGCFRQGSSTRCRRSTRSVCRVPTAGKLQVVSRMRTSDHDKWQ